VTNGHASVVDVVELDVDVLVEVVLLELLLLELVEELLLDELLLDELLLEVLEELLLDVLVLVVVVEGGVGQPASAVGAVLLLAIFEDLVGDTARGCVGHGPRRPARRRRRSMNRRR